MQLALVLQLAGITGNRTDALLGLRSENPKVTLLCDLAGNEWSRMLTEVAIEYSRSLGSERRVPKDAVVGLGRLYTVVSAWLIVRSKIRVAF